MIDHASHTDAPALAQLCMASTVGRPCRYGAYYWWCPRPLLHA